MPTPGDNPAIPPAIPRPRKIINVRVQMGLGADKDKDLYNRILVRHLASILQRSPDMHLYSAGCTK